MSNLAGQSNTQQEYPTHLVVLFAHCCRKEMGTVTAFAVGTKGQRGPNEEQDDDLRHQNRSLSRNI